MINIIMKGLSTMLKSDKIILDTIKEDLKSKDAEKEIVALEIPTSLKNLIRLEAFNRNVSFSAMIRTILLHYYEEDSTKPERMW